MNCQCKFYLEKFTLDYLMDKFTEDEHAGAVIEANALFKNNRAEYDTKMQDAWYIDAGCGCDEHSHCEYHAGFVAERCL